jgi:Right handed beta helix region
MSSTKAVGLALLACLAVPAGARADETLICKRFITVVPFTISAPGHYCFRTDVRTSISTGNAITILADDVLLDLNGFSLDGTAAGTGTNANGIFTFDRRHVTVRNGTVRGFFDGVQLGAGGARVAGMTVERMRVDRTAVGIAVRGLGGGHVVRDNVVTNSGGSTVPGETNGVGISVYGGADVVNNVVTHTFGDSPIAFDVTGGLQTIVNNRVMDSGRGGIVCDDPPAGQYLRDNVVVNTPIPYGGTCQMIGTTNFP